MRKFLSGCAIKLFAWFVIIFCPRYWFQIHPYSEGWDKRLNKLMREYKFELDGSDLAKRYVVKLGTQVIWIANHPYGSFLPYYEPNHRMEFRPRRTTIFLANRKLKQELGIRNKG